MTAPVVARCKKCNQPGATDNGFCPDCIAVLLDEQRVPAYTSLDTILANLIALSEQGGRPKMQQLSGGLVVELTVNQAVQLRIWRLNQAPSDVEWRTVLDNLPDMYRPATKPNYVFRIDGRCHIFSSTWPAPQRLL